MLGGKAKKNADLPNLMRALGTLGSIRFCSGWVTTFATSQKRGWVDGSHPAPIEVDTEKEGLTSLEVGIEFLRDIELRGSR